MSAASDLLSDNDEHHEDEHHEDEHHEDEHHEDEKMSPLVVNESREALLARRRAVLQTLGMTVEEFRDLAGSSRTLTAEEYEAREELDEVAFLLGE
jgi:hypothetical protein